MGFFALFLFPTEKKCGVPGSSVRTCPGTSAHAWTPSAYDVSMGPDEEVDELLAIPLELRTPAQRARLYELISASSQARRRKRKKRRKKKAPKSSSFRSSSSVWPRRCGQGSRSRSSSSGGCGRLCVHARQVPAVADLQWKVPPSITSTKWWTFRLCYGDMYGCLQVQYSDKVVSLPGVVLRLALMVQRVQKPVEFPQVQFLDKVVFLPVIVQRRPSWSSQCSNLWCFHRRSTWTRSCHARCRSDRCSWFRHYRILWRCRSCSSSVFWTRSSASLSWCRDRFPWSCSGKPLKFSSCSTLTR